MPPIKYDELTDDLKAKVIETVKRRVNEAREACGRDPYEELERSHPNSACKCLLGHHLDTWASQMVVSFQTKREAVAVAKAWGTEYEVENSHAHSHWVRLPIDLQVATAAFDAGQLPELIYNPAFMVEDDFATPVEPHRLAATLAGDA